MAATASVQGGWRNPPHAVPELNPLNPPPNNCLKLNKVEYRKEGRKVVSSTIYMVPSVGFLCLHLSAGCRLLPSTATLNIEIYSSLDNLTVADESVDDGVDDGISDGAEEACSPKAAPAPPVGGGLARPLSGQRGQADQATSPLVHPGQLLQLITLFRTHVFR